MHVNQRVALLTPRAHERAWSEAKVVDPLEAFQIAPSAFILKV